MPLDVALHLFANPFCSGIKATYQILESVKMKLNTVVLISIVLFSALCCFGQGDLPLRIEIESKSDEAGYRVIPSGNNGFVLFYETTVVQDSYKFWVIVLYNQFMQETWRKDVPVYQNMSYRRKVLAEDNLFLFFHDTEKKKKENYNYQILKIDAVSGRYELFSGNLPDDARLVDFDVLGEHLVAGMDVGEENTMIFSLNLTTKETKIVYELAEVSSRFENIYIDTLNNSYIGIINVFVSKTENYLLLKEFDFSDVNVGSVIIRPQENKKLNSARISAISKTERLLIGTYDFVKGSSVDKKNYFKNSSTGFYSIKIIDNSPQTGHYYNFLELENMTGYLKSKDYQHALKKASKSEESPEKFSPEFDLLLHDIINKDSVHYFIGEAYYEEYHTVTSTYYDYYGRPMPVSYEVFDGYRYFNTFISCFDRNGNKLWDNGMEIFNILTFDLINRVNIYFAGEETVLAYNREGKIGAKIIKGPVTIEGIEYYPLESMYVNDKIMADSKSSMEYWYDNYFLAYGFQTIKNNSRSETDKRVVFYINKVSFQ